MHWIYLLIASCLEICWLYCVKFMSKDKLLGIDWPNFFGDKGNFLALAPLLGYIGFGIGNVMFFAMAMRQIPASTAFAVWMGVAMVGARLADAAFFNQPITMWQMCFMMLVLAGVVGLKWTSG